MSVGFDLAFSILRKEIPGSRWTPDGFNVIFASKLHNNYFSRKSEIWKQQEN